MVAGAYGPFIHVGEVNQRGSKALTTAPLTNYHLCGLADGAGLIGLVGDTKPLPSPAVLLLPPGGPVRVALPAATAWWSLRFDAVHVPRQRGKTGHTWVHAERSCQPDPLTVWGVEPPLCAPAELVESGLAVLRWCCAHWWRGDLDCALANARLGGWLLELVAHAHRHRPRCGATLCERFEEAACAGMADHLGVGDLARDLNLSRNTLTRRLLRESGETPASLLDRLRMGEACRLLRATDLKLKAIAYCCGYRSVASFSHRFRAVYGLSPKRWQRVIGSQG